MCLVKCLGLSSNRDDAHCCCDKHRLGTAAMSIIACLAVPHLGLPALPTPGVCLSCLRKSTMSMLAPLCVIQTFPVTNSCSLFVPGKVWIKHNSRLSCSFPCAC